MHTPKRILIVRPDRIGDVVLSTPLVRALRLSFPDAWIAEMVRPYTADILEGNPHLNEVLIDDPEDADAGAGGFWRQVGALRRRHFDTALLLLQSRRHAWMTFLAGVPVRWAVGDKVYHRLTFARRVSRRKYIPLRHEADYCLDLGRAIGVRDDGLGVEVFLSDDDRKRAGERIGPRRGALVGIHPGSGASAPNWRVEHYVDLATRLSREGHTVVLTGSAGERRLAEAFAGVSGVVDLVGALTLRETMAVISRLSVLVSASTGTMHIAAATGTPTVSLFCPLPACSPALWGPQSERAEIILPPRDYCRTRCPGDPHVCDLEGGVFVEDVMARLEGVLGAG